MYNEIFLNRLLRNSNNLINKKRILSFDIAQMIPPLDTFVLLCHFLKILEGPKADRFFYLSGKNFGKSLIIEQIQKLGFKKDAYFLQQSLNELEFMSLGSPKILKFDAKNKSIFIKNPNTPFAVNA